MSISMYRASVPVFLQILPCTSVILDKAAAHAAAKKVEPQVFLEARLYPDMFPLTRQVQIASDFAKGACARLAGVEPPKYPDTETTIDELKARISKTIAFIKEFKPSQIDGSEEREISLQMGGQTRLFRGEAYLIREISRSSEPSIWEGLNSLMKAIVLEMRAFSSSMVVSVSGYL